MTDVQNIIEELLRQQAPVSFRAGGSSMNPTIRDGEIVHIRPLNTKHIQRYGVILYRINGRMALHRVIFNKGRTNRCFVVGDAATSGGDWISPSDRLGVAEWVQRGERIHRLDSVCSRMTGAIRFWLRPLRRGLGTLRFSGHADTPAPHS